MLLQIEKKLNFREKLESVNPSVKSFLLGEQSVAVCGLKCILSLVSHGKSASSTNEADLFDFILQRECQGKYMSLYRETVYKTGLFGCFNFECSAIPENVLK